MASARENAVDSLLKALESLNVAPPHEQIRHLLVPGGNKGSFVFKAATQNAGFPMANGRAQGPKSSWFMRSSLAAHEARVGGRHTDISLSKEVRGDLHLKAADSPRQKKKDPIRDLDFGIVSSSASAIHNSPLPLHMKQKLLRKLHRTLTPEKARKEASTPSLSAFGKVAMPKSHKLPPLHSKRQDEELMEMGALVAEAIKHRQEDLHDTGSASSKSDTKDNPEDSHDDEELGFHSKSKKWEASRKDDLVKLAYGEAEVKELRKLFTEFAGAGGELGWVECNALATKIGAKLDKATFRKMDRDRSGRVDFLEMLRCFFPSIAAADLKRAVKRWCVDERVEEHEEVQVEPDFWSQFEEDALAEMLQVFKTLQVQRTDCNIVNGQLPDTNLVLSDLRAAVSSAVVSDEQLKAMFDACDTDQDGELSFREYASLVQDSYLNKNRGQRTKLKLYFQGDARDSLEAIKM